MTMISINDVFVVKMEAYFEDPCLYDDTVYTEMSLAKCVVENAYRHRTPGSNTDYSVVTLGDWLAELNRRIPKTRI